MIRPSLLFVFTVPGLKYGYLRLFTCNEVRNRQTSES